LQIKKIFQSNQFLKSVFIIALFVIFLISAIAYRHIDNLAESTNLVTQTLKVKREFETLVSNLKDAETEHRGFIITGNKTFRINFENAKNKVLDNFINLYNITKDNPRQQSRIASLQKMVLSRFKNLEQTFQNNIVPAIKNIDANSWYTNDKNTISVIQIKVQLMIAVEENLLKHRQIESKNNLAFTPLFLFIILLFTIGIIVLSYKKILTDFEKINKNNQQLTLFEATTKQAEILGKYGSWTWNLSNNTLDYSDNLYRILGCEPQSFEATNGTFLTFVHPEDVLIVENIIQKIIDEENLSFVYFRIIDKQGIVKNLKSFGKLLIDDKGIKTILGITQDASEEVQNILILSDRNKLLERSNKELSAFNYIASHDLQEPLRKIQTFISRFYDLDVDTLPETAKNYLEKISISATRMRVLIDDLLQFSRVNKIEIRNQSVNLNKILGFVKNELSQQIADENIFVFADNLPNIVGVKFQLEQLFLNLIINAIKYKRQGIETLINIESEIVDDTSDKRLKNPTTLRYYKITFADNGMGFEPQYNEKIFILFNRLHNKIDYPGTGIGLSICQKVVENHNGYIFAAGKVSEGAVFTIYFPVV
jgi:signal transduction histidine kinase/CHASE3 domain sensor protein